MVLRLHVGVGVHPKRVQSRSQLSKAGRRRGSQLDRRLGQALRTESDDLSKWWTVFNDPVLNDLICDAYHQNLTLREAGWRVLQARAQLGITVGEIFPQAQAMTGTFQREATSGQTGGAPQKYFSRWDYGFTLSWELDFWGRFRRAIESDSAGLDASVEDYDDVLVTLLGSVATAYVQYRTSEERIKYAKRNLKIQTDVLEITKVKADVGNAKKLDVDQAESILYQTEAGIPELEIAQRVASNQLCILLGIPPEQLHDKLGISPIPRAPADVVIGIPADLLRRRPDVRKAERLAAAQCARSAWPSPCSIRTFPSTAPSITRPPVSRTYSLPRRSAEVSVRRFNGMFSNTDGSSTTSACKRPGSTGWWTPTSNRC